MPKPPPNGSPLWKVWNGFTGFHAWMFQRSGGRLGARWGKAGVLVLHHVGARTGQARTSPLLFGRDGENLILVASKGGSEQHPGWFHNLRAHPETVVDLPQRPDPLPVRARVADEAERERLWPMMVGLYKPYASYQRNTDRRIPIVVLEPRAAA